MKQSIIKIFIDLEGASEKVLDCINFLVNKIEFILARERKLLTHHKDKSCHFFKFTFSELPSMG
jgi:hypothetical protein